MDLKISQLRICKHNWGGLHKVVIAGAKESHELLYPVFPIQKQALGIRKTWPAFIERGALKGTFSERLGTTVLQGGRSSFDSS